VKSRIQRPLPDLEDVVGNLLNTFGHPPAVLPPMSKCSENEEIEGALWKVCALIYHTSLLLLQEYSVVLVEAQEESLDGAYDKFVGRPESCPRPEGPAVQAPAKREIKSHTRIERRRRDTCPVGF
jgi:hypothetical protein